MQVKQEVRERHLFKLVLLTADLTKVTQPAHDAGLHAPLAILPLTLLSHRVNMEQHSLFQLAQALQACCTPLKRRKLLANAACTGS